MLIDTVLTYVGSATKPSPKNLIFASPVKPDLRLSSALDNDVEVVSGADKVLICGFHAIRPLIPLTSGHLFHAYPAGQSERNDVGLHC